MEKSISVPKPREDAAREDAARQGVVENRWSGRGGREGTFLWLYKIVAGGLIVILLGVHFVVNHLLAPAGLLTYQDVLRYYTHPIVPLMEIVFLLVVMSHALIGLRSIILDLNPSRVAMRVIDWVMIIAGVGFSIYGIWLIMVIVQRGQAL